MTFVAEPQFGVSVTYAGSTATVDVCGELDLATAPKLARVLEELPRDMLDVRVSLQGVWFADPPALVRLLRSQYRLGAQGRTLTIVDASDDVLAGMRASGRLAEFIIAEPPPAAAIPDATSIGWEVDGTGTAA